MRILARDFIPCFVAAEAGKWWLYKKRFPSQHASRCSLWAQRTAGYLSRGRIACIQRFLRHSIISSLTIQDHDKTLLYWCDITITISKCNIRPIAFSADGRKILYQQTTTVRNCDNVNMSRRHKMYSTRNKTRISRNTWQNLIMCLLAHDESWNDTWPFLQHTPSSRRKG